MQRKQLLHTSTVDSNVIKWFALCVSLIGTKTTCCQCTLNKHPIPPHLAPSSTQYPRHHRNHTQTHTQHTLKMRSTHAFARQACVFGPFVPNSIKPQLQKHHPFAHKTITAHIQHPSRRGH